MLKVVWSLSGNTMFTCKTLQLGPQAIKGLSKVSRILKSTSPALITPRKSYVQNFCLPGRERFSTTATDNAEGGNEENQNISVTFVDKDGEEKKIKVPIGMSMLEAAHENDIELEGACEGSLACSTCHVIVMDVEHYNKLEDPTDEENDMLDLAFGLTETCMQVTSGLSSNCKT
ncbi:adrenodoxin-like protein 1, mitochondrial isoform X5 [Cynara cardunculus var. scolymus]|uniref:adrenodoxin-like protein 1, mitochondrial isoform X5 n=1 Tax=Cynara cardunculus var. scolymus TaxID=59895 RepID=UPI000D62DDC7|nr:adrenodoxin-like protein 1, mitochondrial isoform X5 [Cynara cardunculus var. scolymus]